MRRRYLATIRSGSYEASFAFDVPPDVYLIASSISRASVEGGEDALGAEFADVLKSELYNMPLESAVRPITGDLYIGSKTRVIIRRFYD